MESAITILAATAFAVVQAAILGYRAEKWMGAFLLSVLVSVAAAVYLVAAALGYYVGGITLAWVGLCAGLIIGGMVLSFGFSKITQVSKSGRFAASLWFGFWALCLFGYLAAGWIGLLVLTLPALLLFWGGLYYISAYILPLRDSRNKSARHKAFRSLLTFAMGTNYPYYFVDEDGRPGPPTPDRRVDCPLHVPVRRRSSHGLRTRLPSQGWELCLPPSPSLRQAEARCDRGPSGQCSQG